MAIVAGIAPCEEVADNLIDTSNYERAIHQKDNP
jgi:hypothetical protein